MSIRRTYDLSGIAPKWLFVVLSVLAAVFVAGIFAGNWLSDQHAKQYLRNLLHELGIGTIARDPNIDSQFYKLRVERTELKPFKGSGGALDEFGDGVVFATPKGQVGFASRRGQRIYVDGSVPMNMESLLGFLEDQGRDEWVPQMRVADVLVNETGDGVAKLFVSHHYYVDRCIEFRISSVGLELDGNALRLKGPWELVYAARPCVSFFEVGFQGNESGGRMLMDGDAHLLVVIGWHATQTVDGLPAAMDPDSDLGKLLRVDLSTGDSELVSSGLRNPQGFSRDVQGTLWESEHGPQGGDELNILVPGVNYGWPVVTYGVKYGGRDWPGSLVQGWHEGYQKPVYAWVPSIAVSSIVFSDNEEFPLWRGDLLVGSLRDRTLHRTRIQNDRVVYVEPITIGRRIRDMVELSGGVIAVLTDDANVLFLSRAEEE